MSLVLRNALRNRRRALLTVLSVGISISLLALLLSLYYAFFLRPPEGAESLRLVTSHRVSITNLLPLYYRDKIRAVPGVRDCMVFQWFGGVYKDSRDPANMFARMSVEPDRFFRIYPEFTMPEEEKRAFIRDRRACVVGRTLARRLGFKVGDRIHIQGDLFPFDPDLVVRGIYDSPRFNESLYFHHDYVVEGVSYLQANVSMFVTIVGQPRDIDRVARAVDAMFRNSAAETRTDTELAFERNFLSYLGDIKLFMLAVCLALTFTLLFVCANTMSMSIRERVREVGILKTLGYSRGAILAMLLAESSMLALAGAAVGLVLAAAGAAALRAVPSVIIDLKPVTLRASIVALCFAVAFLIGIASAATAALGAVRRPITAALRFVD